jgi:hypothetical protein
MSSMSTQLPNGKKGILMDKGHYELLSSFILQTIEKNKALKLTGLLERIPGNFYGIIKNDIPWYILQVKLDLEARQLIKMEVLPHKKRTSFIKLTRHGRKLARQNAR